MPDNQFYNPVSNFFESKGISIPADNQWMQGCIDFCLSENPNANLNEVQAFVFDQWLLADLCDVGVPRLPPNLANRHSSVLQGCFPLQVNEVINVGQSAYSQLQKVRKLATENAEVSDGKPTTQAWEPKGGRMLRLVITDGVQKAFGMEYKPIQTLHEPFVPGFKIIIRGPVESRKGVLLLEERHLTILGGEVDDLVIQNSLENLLLKSLSLETVPNPANIIGAAQTQRAPDDQRSQYTVASQAPPIRNPNPPIRNPNPPPPNPPPSFSSQRSQTGTQSSGIFSGTSSRTSHQTRPLNNVQQNEQIDPDFFNGFLDDDGDELLAMHLDQVTEAENNALNVNNSQDLLSDEDEALLQQVSETLLNQNAVSPPHQNPSPNYDDHFQSRHYSYLPSQSGFDSFNHDNGPSTSHFGSREQKPTNFQENLNTGARSDVGRIRPNQNAKMEPLSNSRNPRIKPSTSQLERELRPGGSSQTLRLPDLPSKRCASSPLKDSQEKYPTEKFIKNSLSAAGCSGFSGSNTNTNQLNLAASFCELFQDRSVPRFVKAKVVSLTTRLRVKDRKWSLSAMISDGLEEINADFSPEVLEKLIQYSAADISKKKDEIEKDPILKVEIRDLLVNAKAKLLTLEAKMKIELPNLLSNPLVTEVIEED